MLKSTATLIFILLGQKGIQGREIKSGSIPVELSSNYTDKIRLKRGARNGGYCQTQADCRNPALDCVPGTPSGGQWGTCMDLWDLRRECTSNADCMNGYTCLPHPSFYRPYCKASVPSEIGTGDINCCHDRDCPLDPTGTYNYCGTKALDPTGVYCHLNDPCENQCLQETCVPVRDECQTDANCPLQTITINNIVKQAPRKCVKKPTTGKKCCQHPKSNCCTDRDCRQGQICCTKYQPPQQCEPCIDPTGEEGCLDPPGIHCVKSTVDCQPCQTTTTNEIYDGCLDPTGEYCVPKKEQCEKCLDPTGVYGCLDPTGTYCVPPQEGSQGCKPCKTKPLDPTGVYDGCLDPTGVYCVLRNNTSGQQCQKCLDPTGVYGCLDPTGVYCIPPSRGERSIQYGMDQFTPQVKRKLDPTGIYRVCEAVQQIQADKQYPARYPPDNWTKPKNSCGNGNMNY